MDRSTSAIARHIRRAREGSSDALNDLLEAHRNYLRLLATACLHRDLKVKADPSDVVQDTLLKVHHGFHEFRGTTEGEWMTWIRRILVRNLADLRRGFGRQRRAIARERSLEAALDRSSAMLGGLLPAPGSSPSQYAERREMGALVADAMATLEDDAREVIVLRSMNELEWSEIAERMGRSADAARMLWARALRTLGTALKEQTT
jgi:RNA polymerase sigma-70 factor (ECF subfamily)